MYWQDPTLQGFVRDFIDFTIDQLFFKEYSYDFPQKWLEKLEYVKHLRERFGDVAIFGIRGGDSSYIIKRFTGDDAHMSFFFNEVNVYNATENP